MAVISSFQIAKPGFLIYLLKRGLLGGPTFFVRDGIHSVADYNSTLMGVVVVVVRIFHDGITRERLELSS